jgi:plasmid replication initiation protein
MVVVQDNSLIESSYSLGIQEMRLLNIGLVKINSKLESKGPITISVDEFCDAYGLIKTSAYSIIKRSIKKIMRTPIKIEYVSDDGAMKIRELTWLVESTYFSGNDGSHIVIEFSPKIEPYLYELKERFTTLDFENLAKLDTPFSIRLYQWLISKKYQSKSTCGRYYSVILDIDWMKDKANLQNKYQRWDVFNKRKIVPAVKKINTTNLSITYKPIKKGRAIHSIEFTFVNEDEGSFLQTAIQRPRLKRKPHVEKNSHAHGVWALGNIKILTQYERESKDINQSFKLEISDVKKLINYYEITGDKVEYSKRKEELNIRLSKK